MHHTPQLGRVIESHIIQVVKVVENLFKYQMDFIESCKTTNDLSGLVATFKKTIESLGFESFSCTSMCNFKNRASSDLFLFDYDDTWVDHYVAKGFQKIDPIIRLTMEQDKPFVWSDFNASISISDDEHDFMNQAGDVGLVNGVTIPVHAHNDASVCINLVTQSPTIADEIVAVAHIVSIYFHQRALDFQDYSNQMNAVELTEIERDILQYTLEGKSTTDLAMIKGLSGDGIKYHLGKVYKKYGVYTKLQACAKAVHHNHIIYTLN